MFILQNVKLLNFPRLPVSFSELNHDVAPAQKKYAVPTPAPTNIRELQCTV
jgi:hypothetical protein